MQERYLFCCPESTDTKYITQRRARGHLRSRLGQPEEGIRDLDQLVRDVAALGHVLQQAYCHEALGLAYAETGNLDLAIEQYRTASRCFGKAGMNKKFSDKIASLLATRGYGGRDFGTRRHSELGRSAAKADAGGPCQIGAQNIDGRSHAARGRLCFHKRAQTDRLKLVPQAPSQ